MFNFTAAQEKEHAEIFYNLLQEVAGENILADGTYPVDLTNNLGEALRRAQHNEYQEHTTDYAHFADVAEEEGFVKVAHTFRSIAAIEKTHGDRFGKFAELIEQDKMFSDREEQAWLCLNCGHIHKGPVAPEVCPVCTHAQGYFIRLDMFRLGI